MKAVADAVGHVFAEGAVMHAARVSAFGKHVYHTEPTLDLDDGLDMRVNVPSQFGYEANGSPGL